MTYQTYPQSYVPPIQGYSSTALRMVAVGQAPPDFKLMNQNNKPVTLGSFKKKKNVVVSTP